MAEPATRERPVLPDRVTMPLLALVTREALDQDYVHAAQRRAARGADAAIQGPGRHRGAAVVVAVFGLLIALAAVQTARNSDVHEASLDALVDRIEERKADVAELDDRIDALRDQNAELQTQGARVRGQLAATTVDTLALEISAGYYVAVRGPGLRITVSDSADGSADGRVRATDLRRLVNGLWRAGAEAIAVNGRRLTNLSAIVQANIAIQVNGGPLSPPYVVSAIGNDSMGLRLDASTSGVQFAALATQFGFQVERQNEPELLLLAAPDAQLTRLHFAERASGPPDNLEDVQ